MSVYGYAFGPFGPNSPHGRFSGGYPYDYEDRVESGPGGPGGMGGNPSMGMNKDYEVFDDFKSNFGYGSSILPLFQSNVKPCPKGVEQNLSNQCRPMYMPCKSDLSCGVSCQVNDYHCGKCSDTNSFRKLCQCCITNGQPIPPIK